MRPTHNIFENVISKPRLDSYKRYFKTKDVDEAIGLYMWNCELSACFSVLLSFFEIALRNNVHREMSLFRSSSKSNNHNTVNSFHWYDKYPYLKYETDEVRKKIASFNPKPDEIVSRLSFGFWIVALGKIESWKLSDIFPFHPLSSNSTNWKDKEKRKAALESFEELKNFRNRVAHHEPLWRFPAIKDTSVKPAIIKIPKSNNLEESLYRFARLLKFLDDAMEAMSPDFHADMLQSTWRKKLD